MGEIQVKEGFEVYARDGRIGAVEMVRRDIQTFDYGQRAPYMVVRSRLSETGRFYIPLKHITLVSDGQAWLDLTVEELSRNGLWQTPPTDIPS